MIRGSITVVAVALAVWACAPTVAPASGAPATGPATSDPRVALCAAFDARGA